MQKGATAAAVTQTCCLFESLREQLILTEFIGQALINQDAAWERSPSIFHQRTGIILKPVLFVAQSGSVPLGLCFRADLRAQPVPLGKEGIL